MSDAPPGTGAGHRRFCGMPQLQSPWAPPAAFPSPCLGHLPWASRLMRAAQPGADPKPDVPDNPLPSDPRRSPEPPVQPPEPVEDPVRPPEPGPDVPPLPEGDPAREPRREPEPLEDPIQDPRPAPDTPLHLSGEFRAD